MTNDKLCEVVEEGQLWHLVGLEVVKSELRRLRKVECDVHRNKSTTVVKNNLRMVTDLVTEKIAIEVSRQADGQRLAVEKVDVEKCLAAGECQLIGQGSKVTYDMRQK